MSADVVDVLGCPAEVSGAGRRLSGRFGDGVAAALAAAGIAADPALVDDSDWTVTTTVDATALGNVACLELEGLSPGSTVRWDGEEVARVGSAFVPVRVQVPTGRIHTLSVCTPPLAEVPRPARPRPAWKSTLVADQSVRWLRAPLHGRIGRPGALPPVARLLRARLEGRPRPQVDDVWLDEDGTGVVRVGSLPDDGVDVLLDGRPWPVADAGTGWSRIDVRAAETWWPHTHGEPRTYRLQVLDAGSVVLDRAVGFRRVSSPADDFGIEVNGVPVHIRGTVWEGTTPDGGDDRESANADLTALRRCGINLVRVPGLLGYRSDAWWDACDRLGILVWQDAALASLAPPDAPEWLELFEAELRHQLGRLRSRPSLAVVSAGSEVLQQPSLLGLPVPEVPALDRVAAVAAELLPGVPYVPSSPHGGTPLTRPDTGTSHYFGVGAFGRPLEDARSARVRFAAECLPLAVPDGSCTDPAADRCAGVPRDRNQDWDFLDVTDRYRPAALCEAADAQLKSDLARRIAVAHAVQETMAAWRSSLTPTRGAITISHRDGAAGSGWGLLDVSGRPKAALLASAATYAPVAVLILEDGLNGIRLEVVNDGGRPVAGSLELTAWTAAATAGATGSCLVRVPARGRVVLDAETVLGQFLDLAHAWKFGPRNYLLLTATLDHAPGPVRAARVIGGPLPPLQREPRLDARLHQIAPEEWMIEITADAPAPWCHVDLSTPHRASSGWQHAAPGHPVTVLLHGAGTPQGVAHAAFATAVPWTRSAAA